MRKITLASHGRACDGVRRRNAVLGPRRRVCPTDALRVRLVAGDSGLHLLLHHVRFRSNAMCRRRAWVHAGGVCASGVDAGGVCASVVRASVVAAVRSVLRVDLSVVHTVLHVVLGLVHRVLHVVGQTVGHCGDLGGCWWWWWWC